MTRFELFYPVKPWTVSQGFGGNPQIYKQFGIDGHNGVDIVTAHGQPVYASHDGIVSYTGLDANEGVGVVIRTKDVVKYDGGEAHMKSIYWHLINNIQVRIGQEVKAGDLIGYADNTGFSTGNHLHFAIKPIAKGESDWTWGNLEQKNGYHGAINPETYFNGYYAVDSVKVFAILNQILSTLKAFLGLK